MSNPDTMEAESKLAQVNERNLRDGSITCPVRRHLLKREKHKLYMRAFRRSKMVRPTPTTVLKYRGHVFYFSDSQGRLCSIVVNSDNTFKASSHFNTTNSVLPLVGARKHVQIIMDYFCDDFTPSPSIEDDEDRCDDISHILAEQVDI